MTTQRLKTWRFWTLLVALAAGGAIINLWERAGEAHVARRPLGEFPAAIGAWRKIGSDARFDKETENILRADDYLSRDYATASGAVASLYVGYYASQRSGATYHSPLNCLPGAGWTMSDGSLIEIKPQTADGRALSSFRANRYVVQNGDSKQILIYWYQGRGRALASEYWGKFYTALDSARRRRSDGAMVRVTAPVGRASDAESERKNVAAAEASAVEFASRVAAALPEFVPD